MCGRYALIKDEQLKSRYDKPFIGGYALNPRYNIAPTQHAPVITSAGIEIMRWGLMPSWLKDPRASFSMINARSENLLERPAYRGLIASHRCLVPASGFYEWQDVPGGKQPYYVFVKDSPLISFAGLYTVRRDAEDQIVKSFTIVTTEPNELVAKIYNRMPVIFEKDEEVAWLDETLTDPGDVLPMLDAYPAGLMDMHPVGTQVGNVSNDSPSLIEPESYPKS
jgi:putative SOS response-associated peptidase YedK